MSTRRAQVPRLSTLSNPTSLVDIDKKRLGIVLDETGGRLAFSLVRLDLADLRLQPPLDTIVIVRRGSTEERIELGPAWDWDKSLHRLSEIGPDGTWSFRVLLVRPSSAQLVAAAENVRPSGQGDSESFIALEPADLGEVPWEVEIREQEGRAVLRFSKEVYHSTGEAEADRVFSSLVLPEAIRQLAAWVSRHPSVLGDDEWAPLKSWLVFHGITDEPEPDDEDQQADWVKSVTSAFCERFEFVTKLTEARNTGSDE